MNMKTAHDLVLEARQYIVEITPKEALTVLDNKPLVVDVREPEEYLQGHIPFAINIPRGVLEFRMSQEPNLIDRQRSLLIYCKTSGRAALAARSLGNLGFSDVKSIAGGFDAWCSAGFATERPQSLSFD